MIGTNPNLDLPSGSDPLATIVAKVITALGVLQTSIADKATPAALNMNAPLSMAGNAITQVSTLQLAQGNVSVLPGSIYYGSDGEFYAVDLSGTAVKLTANGQINIGGTGGFVGDYVASNPTGAAFDAASGQFRFTKTAGAAWADLVAANLILEGSAGTVKFGVDSAINTARTVNVKSLPTSGISLLVYNAATSTLENGAVTAPTNALASLSVATLTTTTDDKHTFAKGMALQIAPALVASNCTATDHQILSTAPSWAYSSPSIPLREGDRIKTITLWTNTGLGSVTVTLKKRAGGSLSDTTVDVPHLVTFSGANSYSVTIGSPVAFAAGEHFWIELSGGSNSGESLTPLRITWDHP
jgi:hypothetical protein